MSLYLLFDCQFLAHRAYHSVGGLQHEGEATGVAFGVLRDIEYLTDMFGADATVHAWDFGGPGLRGQAVPGYKAGRAIKAAEWSDEEKQSRAWFREQVLDLRQKHLIAMGYRNVFCVPGYEADDIIAVAVNMLGPGDEAIIISADKDLWQCLGASVSCYNPITKKLMTIARFQAEYFGIDPALWASVKALAGCDSDDIVGIAGVGDKTAAAYYGHKLNPKTKKYHAILENLHIHNENIKLTRLPYPGLKLPALQKDQLSEEGRIHVHCALGMRHDRRPRQAQPTLFD
jgi:5'-3' exonuclease